MFNNTLCNSWLAVSSCFFSPETFQSFLLKHCCHWDMSVICLTVASNLIITVFIRLIFRQSDRNDLIFFGLSKTFWSMTEEKHPGRNYLNWRKVILRCAVFHLDLPTVCIGAAACIDVISCPHYLLKWLQVFEEMCLIKLDVFLKQACW